MIEILPCGIITTTNMQWDARLGSDALPGYNES